MTFGFTSFFNSISVISYMKIMNDCVNWNPVTVEKISPRAGLESGTAKIVGQQLPTEHCFKLIA